VLSRTFLRALIIGGRAVAGEPEGAVMVTVDGDLLDAADLDQLEQVEVRGISGGNALEAILLRGPSGSGVIRVDGCGPAGIAAGGAIAITAWSTADRTELPTLRARIVAVDRDNRIIDTMVVPVAGAEPVSIPH
jgi:aspartate 1-decarboxylase